MSLVLDQGVPRDAAIRLRGLGYECIHLGEIGMSKAADEEILAFSLEGNRSDLEADLHTTLALSGASGPSVIRLRLQGLGAFEVVELFQSRFRSRSEARMQPSEGRRAFPLPSLGQHSSPNNYTLLAHKDKRSDGIGMDSSKM